MRRKKTILDVLREAQGQKGEHLDPRKKADPDSRARSTSEQVRSYRKSQVRSSKGEGRGDSPLSSIWSRSRSWFLTHPALGGGISLALLFLLVFGIMQWEGPKTPPLSPKTDQEKISDESSQKKSDFQPSPSGLENTPRLMGGGKLDSSVKTASNTPSKRNEAVPQNRSKLRPETWARRKLRFFRISSYKNPRKTVIGYASSMARFLRGRGFAAEHAWLKKKSGKQLIVFVRIPQGLSKEGEAKLFSRLQSLGFVKKPKDKTDDGFQFNFRKLRKNIGRASFRVRVGMGEKG